MTCLHYIFRWEQHALHYMILQIFYALRDDHVISIFPKRKNILINCVKLLIFCMIIFLFSNVKRDLALIIFKGEIIGFLKYDLDMLSSTWLYVF